MKSIVNSYKEGPLSQNKLKQINRKELTYEEIGKIKNISTQQVHKIEKEAMNKILRRMVEKNKLDIFDSILYFSHLFGLPVEQCYKKLDAYNKDLLKQYFEEKTIDRI